MLFDPTTLRPLKRGEYDKLVALGAFEGERVELLHGAVARMSPKGPSLAVDRNVKAPIYAAAGVPEYWVVNLVDRVIEVSTDPRDGRYTTTKVHRKGSAVTLAAFPDGVIAVDAILL